MPRQIFQESRKLTQFAHNRSGSFHFQFFFMFKVINSYTLRSLSFADDAVENVQQSLVVNEVIH
jgi:hypothetical protein